MPTMYERVLRAVAEEGPFAHLADLLATIKDPGEPLHIAVVVAAIDFLALEGKLTTRRSRADHFTLIEASRAGYVAAGLPERPVGAQVGSNGAGALPSLHPGDPTDYHNHGRRAEGGPITRSITPMAMPTPPTIQPRGGPVAMRARLDGDGHVTAAVIEALAPDKAWTAVVHLAGLEGCTIRALGQSMGLSPSPTTIRVRKAAALGWLTITGSQRKRLYTTAKARHKLGLETRKEPRVEPKVEPVVEPKAEPNWMGVVSGATYPAIAALMARSERLEALAAALDTEGFTDEALAVLARLDSLTALERDVLRLVRGE